MNIDDLDKYLGSDHIEFRTGRTFGDYAYVLAYKNARVDMDILDEVVGKLNWKSEYQRDSKGVLQCKVSIWDENKKEWVSKTSNGVESNTEEQKGEYSDAFKRACFMWGIGRRLYDFPEIKIKLTDWEKNNGGKTRFYPNSFRWELSGNYDHIKAYDKGNLRFEYGKKTITKPMKQIVQNIENKIITSSISDSQKGLISSLMKDKNISIDSAKSIMKVSFNKISRDQLTKSEASQFINILKEEKNHEEKQLDNEYELKLNS